VVETFRHVPHHGDDGFPWLLAGVGVAFDSDVGGVDELLPSGANVGIVVMVGGLVDH